MWKFILMIGLMHTLGSCQTLRAIFSDTNKQEISNEVISPVDPSSFESSEEGLTDTLSNGVLNPNEDAPVLQIDTLFILEKTKCFDSCPNYSLTFLSDGKVYLKAIDNLFIQGFYQCNIEGIKLDAITELSIKFMDSSYEPGYPTDGIFLDGIPKSILVGQSGPTKKVVVCQYDCPEEIIHLSQYLEQIIPTLDWQKIRL